MSGPDRILVVTAGLPEKRNAMAAAMSDLFGAAVIAGKQHRERATDRAFMKLGCAGLLGAHAKNVKALNADILGRAGTFDILFVVKGNLVTASTLRALKAGLNPPRILGWSPDDMALPHNSSRIFRAAAPLYDTFYTSKSRNIANGELASLGFEDPRYLPQGFDQALHRPARKSRSRFAGLVTFVGYGEQDRFENLNALARSGIAVQVWGNGWSRAMSRAAHSNLTLHGHPLLGDDYADALSNSAISLCFLRKLNRDLHTSRTFEIPACGGFMLAERTAEHRSFFREGAEAAFFGDTNELVAQTRTYMADDTARRRIADAGRRRCLNSDYSYHALARRIIDHARAA